MFDLFCWQIHSTAFNIFLHELCEIRPPKFGSDELASLEVTRVASSLVVVATDKDGMSERICQRDIDMTFVH